MGNFKDDVKALTESTKLEELAQCAKDEGYDYVEIRHSLSGVDVTFEHRSPPRKPRTDPVHVNRSFDDIEAEVIRLMQRGNPMIQAYPCCIRIFIPQNWTLVHRGGKPILGIGGGCGDCGSCGGDCPGGGKAPATQQRKPTKAKSGSSSGGSPSKKGGCGSGGGCSSGGCGSGCHKP